MKILYSAGSRVGSDLLLSKFLKECKHEVYVAAYERGSDSLLHVDFTLDAMYHRYSGCNRVELNNLLGRSGVPMMGNEICKRLLEEVESLDIDLVICDYEPMMSSIAKSLGKRLWYYSPVHLLDGLKWGRGWLRYTGLLEVTRKNLSNLPEADRVYVCSAFSMFGLELKSGYEWLLPSGVEDYGFESSGSGIYLLRDEDRASDLRRLISSIPPYDLEIINLDDRCYREEVGSCEWMFNGGESVYLAEGILNRVKRFCISPDLSDPEGLLNASLTRVCGIGDDVGQIEYLEYEGREAIEKSYGKRFGSEISLIDIEISNLNKEVDRYASSL